MFTRAEAIALVSSYINSEFLKERFKSASSKASDICSKVAGALTNASSDWSARDMAIYTACSCVPGSISHETVSRDSQKKSMDFFQTAPDGSSDFLLLLSILIDTHVSQIYAVGIEVVQKEKGQSVPSISQVLVDRVTGLHFSKKKKTVVASNEPSRLLGNPANSDMVLMAGGIEVGRSEVMIAPELFAASKSLLSHRLLRFLVTKGSEQFHAGMPQYMDITVNGGFQELCETLSVPYNGETVGNLMRIFSFYQHAQVSIGKDRYFGLMTWSHLGDSGHGKQAPLRFRVSDALLPTFVCTLGKSTIELRRARRLVPLPKELPELVGTNVHNYAAQSTFQILILSEFREQSATLEKHGVIILDEQMISKLAESADLPLEVARAALDTWSTGEKAWLSRDGNEFGLTDLMFKEREMLLQGAKLASMKKRRAHVARK